MATANSSRPQTFSLAKTSSTNYGQCSGEKADQCNVHFALCPPEGQQAEVKQALVCPSIYPYLLTLRGGNLQKDLVLYPLKTSAVTIFGAPVADREGFSASYRRVSSQGHEDLVLHASDLLQPHCRLHIMPPSPADPRPGSSRARAARYGYSLLVEVLSSRAPVFLNGRRVEAGKDAAEVRPGDLLGVGLRYLFLFKDPTGGQDVPDCLPWYPAPPDHHLAQLSPRTAEEEPQEPASESRYSLAVEDLEAEENEYCALADCESVAGKSLELPYPQDREEEVLNYIASISCSSPADFPHTTAVLLLGCHDYVSRRRPARHQPLFFVRLLNAVRSRVNEVSRVLSMQKYNSNLYAPSTLDSQHDDALREDDPLLELLCWLSNLLALHGHVTSAPFRCRLATPLPDATTESVEELRTSLEEMVRFLFQQAVYSVSKVLFSPLSQILQLSDTSPAVDMERVLHVLRTTLHVSEDVSLHRDVTVQLLIYLLFFVTTTLFNKLMAKGADSQCFCWGAGERLRDILAQLQDWAASLGLEAHYGTMAQRLAALVDLLATPPHVLLRMDWSAFRRQYWTLSESQLHRVLAEYQFPDGQSAPASWDPPSGMHTSQEVTISLSSHPPFVLPSDPSRVDLATTFPPPLYRHLHDIISRFSERASYSHRTPDNKDPKAEQVPSAAPFLSLPSDAPSSFSTASTLLSSPSSSSSLPRTSCSSSQHSHRSDSIHVEHQHYSQGSGEAAFKGQASPPRTCAGRGCDGDGPDLLSRTPPLPPRWSDSSDSPPPRPPKPRSPPGDTIPAALPPDQNSAGSVSSPRIADTSSPRPETQDRYGGLVRNDNNVDAEHDHHSSDSSDSVMDPLSTLFSSLASSPKLAGNGKVKSTRIAGSVSERRDCHSCKCHRLPSVFASVVGQADLSQPCDKTSGRARQSPNSLPQRRCPLNKTLQQQDSSDLQEQVLETPQTSAKARRERRNKKAAGNGLVLLNYHRADPPPPYPRDAYVQNDPVLLSRHDGDPRRRPITKVLLGSNQDVNGTLSLQDKRPVNNVSPLMIGVSPPHQVTDSIVSDDSPSTNLADLSLALEFTSPVSSLSKHVVVAAGAIPNEANNKNVPDVVKTEMHSEGVSPVNINTEKFPDDVYIDVAVQATQSHTIGSSGNSDSTQLEDVPRVRYLHRMPQEKDASRKGDITGEVFTLTLLKESSRLGMGLIDGMYTALKLPGIYVRNVLPGTPAALCGHIRVGDRILAVNGQSIVGADYSSATKMIRDSGPMLDLLIAKCDRSVTACISAS